MNRRDTFGSLIVGGAVILLIVCFGMMILECIEIWEEARLWGDL